MQLLKLISVVFSLCSLLPTAFGFRAHLPRWPGRLTAIDRLAPLAAAVKGPGESLYDAAYKGDLVKMQAVIAECKGNKQALNWQNMERYGRTPLVIAAYYNKIDAVKLLLATPGVDINCSSDFGATALHFAAHRGHLEVVKLLLAKGAKVNALATGGKWTGKTPLDVVTGMGMSGKPEISEAIKAKGGKPGK